MAACAMSRTIIAAVTALLGSALLSGPGHADSIENVMGGFMRDARSSFARMVPLDLVTTMPSLQPPPIQQPAAIQPPPPVQAAKPQAAGKPVAARPALSPAATELAAAKAAETVADANLDAALAANEKAVSDRGAADALAKTNPTPATIAAAKAAAEAAYIAEANLTDALLADKQTDARLKAARDAFAAEQNARKSSTAAPATTPVSLADK